MTVIALTWHCSHSIFKTITGGVVWGNWPSCHIPWVGHENELATETKRRWSVKLRYTSDVLEMLSCWNREQLTSDLREKSCFYHFRSRQRNTHWTHAVQLSQRFRWRQDFVKFTHLYKTGQNGKGDRLIVWRHFLKRVTLIQRSIMEYQYFIYCSCYTTFLYSVTCVHGNMPTLLQKVFS